MEKPTETDIRRMYCEERISPDAIGKMFGVSGKTIRNKLKAAGITMVGASHLRKGRSATWNKGLKRSKETINKIRQSKMGTVPHNKNDGRVQFMCAVCDVLVFDKPYRRSKFCTKACRDEYSSLMRGENHWNFKGDLAGFRQRSRLWIECKEWRLKVIKKDGSQCQKCGGRSDLTAHHIKSWAKNIGARFDVNNGATLCWPCHTAFHGKFGLHRSTEEDYLKWITM